MSTMTSYSFTRSTSVMSILADQMQSSCLNEINVIESGSSQFVDYKSFPNEHSIGAPIRRYSIPDMAFSSLYPQSDSTVEHEYKPLTDSDLISHEIPPKRICHSSPNDCIARPTPIKVNTRSQFVNPEENCPHNKPSKISIPIKTPQRNSCNFNMRLIISPHHKKSAFTPTGSLTSPQTTNSDYSLSPEMGSPIYRPASVTSSGFHDSSEQSPLIYPDCSPDTNQRPSCTNAKTPESLNCLMSRCHFQSCDEHISTNLNNRPVIVGSEKACSCLQQSTKYPAQLQTPMKRRHPSPSHIRSISQSDTTNGQHLLSPVQCHPNKLVPNSSQTSPNACGSLFAVPKRDGYFFGSGRSYLVSLPRIASSPPLSIQAESQEATPADSTRMGSGSSCVSTLTTTGSRTPIVMCDGSTHRKSVTESLITDVFDDVDMRDSLDMHMSDTALNLDNQRYANFQESLDNNPFQMSSDLYCLTSNIPGQYPCASLSSCSAGASSDMTANSYSTNSDATSHCTNASLSIISGSSRSDCPDPDDSADIAFCFSQLNDAAPGTACDEHSSFQELDLDQIELD